MAVTLYLESRGHDFGEQIFDWWFAWLQSNNQDYSSPVQVVTDRTDADRCILIDHMGLTLHQDDFDRFDMILIGNGVESLTVGSPAIQSCLKHDKCFLLSNSRLLSDHHLSEKNIWFPGHVYAVRDYWTRPFYAQFFEFERFSVMPRTSEIVIVSGQHRAWRVYFWQLLKQIVPEIFINVFFDVLLQTQQESCWESSEDTAFRQVLQELYGTGHDYYNQQYYHAGIDVGPNAKFGKLPPGFFFIPYYFTHSCVITAESTWLNHELDISEKTLKCFVSGSLPLPIAGCMVNHQYNELGYATAWNLLPDNLQKFDSMINHQQRYSLMADAVKWLHDNRENVFQSDTFKNLTEHNKKQYFGNNLATESIKQFHKTLQKHCFSTIWQ